MFYENYTIEKLYPKIKEISKACLPDHDEDLAQEVALKLWALIQKEKLPQQFHGFYLKQMVLNTRCDVLRKLRRQRSIPMVVNENGSISTVCNLDQQRFVSELITQASNEFGSVDYINRALGQIPEEQRQALLLLSEGRTYQEIAQLTDSQVGTVRSRIHYARIKVQKLINEDKINEQK